MSEEEFAARSSSCCEVQDVKFNIHTSQTISEVFLQIHYNPPHMTWRPPRGASPEELLMLLPAKLIDPTCHNHTC